MWLCGTFWRHVTSGSIPCSCAFCYLAHTIGTLILWIPHSSSSSLSLAKMLTLAAIILRHISPRFRLNTSAPVQCFVMYSAWARAISALGCSTRAFSCFSARAHTHTHCTHSHDSLQQARLLEECGQVEFNEEVERRFAMVSIPSWFGVETKTGVREFFRMLILSNIVFRLYANASVASPVSLYRF